MAENKTNATRASVTDYLAAIEDDERRKDCKAIAAMMKRVTGCPAVMWGTSIVGFDHYQYKYDSGRTGEMCAVGFSNRKGDISIYLLDGYDTAEAQTLLAQLGKHKIGKACLYVKRLADVDTVVLKQLIARSVAEVKRRYSN